MMNPNLKSRMVFATSALTAAALGGACIGTDGAIHRSTSIQESQETGRAMADYQRRTQAQRAPQPPAIPDRLGGGEGGGGGGGGH